MKISVKNKFVLNIFPVKIPLIILTYIICLFLCFELGFIYSLSLHSLSNLIYE